MNADSGNSPVTFILPDGMRLGGVTVWSLQMSHQLAECNYPVSLVEHVQPHALLETPLHPQIRLLQCYGTRPFLATTADLGEYLPTYQRIIPGTIVPNWSCGTYGACAAISAKHAENMRVIGFCHSDEEPYYEWLSYYEPIIHKFVAVSPEIEAILRQRIPYRHNDIVGRPYAVEVVSELKRTYSSATQPIELVYAGRLYQPQKRIFDLIRLAERLSQKNVNFRLTIAGEGEHQEDLHHRLTVLPAEISQRIRLAGKLPHHRMPMFWQSGDVCISVSEFEGTSISMLEAMAYGCVPIVTHVSGARTTIRSGENGYCVNIGDMESMAHIIQQLARAREHLWALGNAAYTTIAKQYSYRDYRDWFLEINREIWRHSSRRWPQSRPLLPVFPPPDRKNRLALLKNTARAFYLGVRHALPPMRMPFRPK